MTQLFHNHDYVYLYGIEWEDELLDCFRRDAEAQRTMRRLGVTLEDVRRYYLKQPHFDHIYRQLVEHADDRRNPMEMLMIAVAATKLAHLKRMH